MNYRILKANCFNLREYSLVPIRMEDKFAIKNWRNDQMSILRQRKPLSDDDQEAYFANVVSKLFEKEFPEQILFSFLKRNSLIGYGGLVHIDWDAKSAEISFLLETSRNGILDVYQEDFLVFLRLIKEVAFDDLKFFRINTYSYDVRPYLYSPLEKARFKEEARLVGANVIAGTRCDTVIHTCFRKDYEKESLPAYNVLATSISAKTSFLNDIRKAIESLGTNSKLFGGDTNPGCIGKYFVDEFWAMPALHDDTFTEILKFCIANEIKAIIPSRDGELEYWSKYKQALSDHGISTMVSDLKSLRLSNDKISFYKRGIEHGISVIQTAEDINEISAESFVVKERFGAGSRNVALNVGRTEAVKFAKELLNPIFQPFIFGREYSVDFYVNKLGKIKGIVPRVRDKIVSGESQITTVRPNRDLEHQCNRFVELLDLFGHGMFQVLEDEEGKFHFIECNARYGGASSLSIAAGLTSFTWFLQESLGQTDDNVQLSETQILRQVRYTTNLVLRME